jgi:hypothetical protein
MLPVTEAGKERLDGIGDPGPSMLNSRWPKTPVRSGSDLGGPDGHRVSDTCRTRRSFDHRTKKQATSKWPVLFCLLVDASGIEPPTPTVSRRKMGIKRQKKSKSRALANHVCIENSDINANMMLSRPSASGNMFWTPGGHGTEAGTVWAERRSRQPWTIGATA